MKKVILMRAWVRSVSRSAGLVAVIALSLAACGQATTPKQGSGTSPASSRPVPASTHATTSTTPPPPPSAASQLAAFFAAAQQADSQLRHTAALVNGDIGTTSMRFTPATLAAIRALGNAPVARTIPAGLPTGLLRDVLVVYGDLASRTAAFTGVRVYGYSGRVLPIGGPDAKEVLRGLRNGAPAAARFSGDLAAARTLAGQTPVVPIAAPESRAAAELALRLRSIDLVNDCSYTFGGYAPTSFEPVVWQPGTGPGHYAGTISGVRFQATYTDHTWEIMIYAC
jgi:hypothetical protein